MKIPLIRCTLPVLTSCLGLLGSTLAADSLDRTSLPIPQPQPKSITTLDARDAKAPPRFEVKAPENAPNVVIALISPT